QRAEPIIVVVNDDNRLCPLCYGFCNFLSNSLFLIGSAPEFVPNRPSCQGVNDIFWNLSMGQLKNEVPELVRSFPLSNLLGGCFQKLDRPSRQPRAPLVEGFLKRQLLQVVQLCLGRQLDMVKVRRVILRTIDIQKPALRSAFVLMVPASGHTKYLPGIPPRGIGLGSNGDTTVNFFDLGPGDRALQKVKPLVASRAGLPQHGGLRVQLPGVYFVEIGPCPAGDALSGGSTSRIGIDERGKID